MPAANGCFPPTGAQSLNTSYYDLGSVTYATGGLASDMGAVLNPGTGTGVAAVATSSQVRFKDSIVRVGVNYHFSSPAASQY